VAKLRILSSITFAYLEHFWVGLAGSHRIALLQPKSFETARASSLLVSPSDFFQFAWYSNAN
jgi:hypothetical protein